MQKILKIGLVGKTNAGKSTLLNNLVGETISIVNKKINTTEELVRGIVNIGKNQLIFNDSPGVSYARLTDNKSKKLKKNLWEALNNCDLILYIIDCKNNNYSELKKNINKIKELNKKIIIVFNKNDLIEKKTILPNIKRINNEIGIENFFSISAKKKLGLDNLKNFLLKNTYTAPWIFNKDIVSDRDDIFITNEITRNAILDLLNQEIPYNITIKNRYFKFLKNGDLKIKQDLEIQNDRYKKIIIGRNGSKIKNLRIKSQKIISKTLNTNIHLYINVIIKNAKKI
tara:strand:+ start:97 stop:951 length:855 start_codon:yes stop_codon:yes gene_type:complete